MADKTFTVSTGDSNVGVVSPYIDGLFAIINEGTDDDAVQIRTITASTLASETAAGGRFAIRRWDQATQPYSGGLEQTINAHNYLTTGFLDLGIFANDTSIGTAAWTSPSNASASDDTYASVSVSARVVTNYLKGINPNPSIPSSATIKGVRIRFERLGTSGTGQGDFSIRLVKGGVVSGKDKAVLGAWELVDTYRYYGGANDLWDLSLTPADVNATDFGFVIAALGPMVGPEDFQVDHMQMEIYYTDLDANIKVLSGPSLSSPPTLLDLRYWTDTPTFNHTNALGTAVSNLPGRVTNTRTNAQGDMLRQYGFAAIDEPIVLRANQGVGVYNANVARAHAGRMEVLFRRVSDGQTFNCVAEVTTRGSRDLPLMVIQNYSSSTVIEIFALQWFDFANAVPGEWRLALIDGIKKGFGETSLIPVGHDTNQTLPSHIKCYRGPFYAYVAGSTKGARTDYLDFSSASEDTNPATSVNAEVRIVFRIWDQLKAGKIRNCSVVPIGTDVESTLLQDQKHYILFKAKDGDSAITLRKGEGLAVLQHRTVVLSISGILTYSMFTTMAIEAQFTYTPEAAGGSTTLVMVSE